VEAPAGLRSLGPLSGGRRRGSCLRARECRNRTIALAAAPADPPGANGTVKIDGVPLAARSTTGRTRAASSRSTSSSRQPFV